MHSTGQKTATSSRKLVLDQAVMAVHWTLAMSKRDRAAHAAHWVFAYADAKPSLRCAGRVWGVSRSSARKALAAVKGGACNGRGHPPSWLTVEYVCHWWLAAAGVDRAALGKAIGGGSAW